MSIARKGRRSIAAVLCTTACVMVWAGSAAKSSAAAPTTEPLPAAGPVATFIATDDDGLILTPAGADGTLKVGVPEAFDRAGEEGAEIVVTLTQGDVSVVVPSVRQVDPVSVVLLIDTSGSMKGEPIRAARAAAFQFIDALPKDALLSVNSFGAVVGEATGFSTDRTVAKRRVNQLTARGETSLRDGLLDSAGSFPIAAKRRAIVVLSDGADTVSKALRESAKESLRTSGISVQAIVLESSIAVADAGGEAPSAELQAITEVTGGALIRSLSPADLGSAFSRIAGVVGSPLSVKLPPEIDPTQSIVVVVARQFAAGKQEWTGQTSKSAQASAVISEPGFVAPLSPTATVPAGAPQAPTVSTPVPDPGRKWLLIGALGTLSSLLAGCWLLFTRQPRRRLAAEYGNEKQPLLATMSTALETGAERLVRRHDGGGRIRNALEGTGWSVQPGAVLSFVGLVTVSAAALGFLAGGLTLLLVTILMVPLGAWMVIRIAADRRRNKFQDQFEGTLQLMANSLRSGYGVNQAMDTVAREAQSPTSDEFQRALQEARLGQDQIVSLRAMSARVRSDDLDWVIDAIEVNREVGGSLSELFASVADTVRARGRLARQVKALSAEGRISAWVLVLLPIIVFALISIINPKYVDELTGTVAGRWMLSIAVILMGIGVVWLRKIVKIVL
jgi:tight adherence protein B